MSELLKGKEVIVFDLGNVVIDLHYHRTADQLAQHAGLRPEDLGDLLVTSGCAANVGGWLYRIADSV